MPPQTTPRRKQKPRQQNPSQQLQPAPIQSDYESEVVSSKPEKPTRTNDQLNFAVLKRYVPDLQSIISIAPSTQIYVFSPEQSTWEKTAMEGPLFICEIAPSPVTGSPQHCVVVLNRRGFENLIIEMSKIENVENTEKFLLITCRSGGELKTMGFYMYEDTTDTKRVNCQLIMNFWELAVEDKEKQGAVVERMGLQGDKAEDMVREMSSTGQMGMGRRLSLSELFGARYDGGRDDRLLNG